MLTSLFVAIGIFILFYVLLIMFYENKHFVIWGGVFLYLIFGIISPIGAVKAINWNVMGVFLGTMIVANLFIDSKMADYLATVTIKHTKKVGIAIVAMCMLAGFISIFAENVATVLIIAPIAIAIANKLKTSPAPFLIGIAVSSNLQGAGTLIGDPPSMILAGYAKMTFNDFFWLLGKPSIFFAVQIGALASLVVLFFLFRKYNKKTEPIRKATVKSYFPTILIVVMIVSLAFSSYFDKEFSFLAGIICMVTAFIGLIWKFLTSKKIRMQVYFMENIDWNTTFFLLGLFIMVGGLSDAGVIASISNLIINISGTSTVFTFFTLVWLSVFFSAFIDNVPFLAAMIPVAATLAKGLGASPYLFFFGLLIGASVGGNITPIGASANIVATGLLKKEDIKVKFFDFVKIGLPFTLVSTTVAVVFVWMFWA